MQVVVENTARGAVAISAAFLGVSLVGRVGAKQVMEDIAAGGVLRWQVGANQLAQ
jgi:hypothetical protein